MYSHWTEVSSQDGGRNLRLQLGHFEKTDNT